MNNESGKSPIDQYVNDTLEKIAKQIKQMEGQINSFLPQRGYRLRVYAPYFEGQEPTYGKLEKEKRLYPVPDFRTAILVMDILYSEYRMMNFNYALISLECLNPQNDLWEEWEDHEGNSIREYYLNENYVPHLGDGEYSDYE